MGLFNTFANQNFELTPKQIVLEYGNIFIEGEIVQKAVKLNFDKWVFTNYRLLLILACKGARFELVTIPYSSIRKFSLIKSISDNSTSELNIYLRHEEKAIRKEFKSADIVNELYRLLTKYISNVSGIINEIPMVKIH
jgi:hypothetical protein